MSNLILKVRDKIKYQILRQDELNKEMIFVIGLAKTGTKSITESLEVLGFKSIHWAPLGRIGRGGLLEFNWQWWLNKYDAFTDVPVTYFFTELDKKFPNAKFIQTLRDKDSWLESCRKHFCVPSIHEEARLIHQGLYGSDIFEHNAFSDAYDRHHQIIKEYFQGRTDFIQMDICAGDGWEKLCSFLNKDVPDKPFPKSNTNRPVVLTTRGLEKIKAAIRQAEIQENAGQPYTKEELSKRIGLDSKTIANILEGKLEKNKRAIKVCFGVFSCGLEDEDYTLTQDQSQIG